MADDDWGEEQRPGSWLDTAKNVAQTADDTVRATANAQTFGMADRFAGAMEGLISGKGYNAGVDEQVKLSEAARQRSPVMSTVGDFAGSMAIPGLGAARLAARLGGGALARALGYGATGAATGAAQGAGSTYTGDWKDYVKNGLFGGAVGAPLGAVGGAAFGARPRVTAAETPDVNTLYHAKNMDYDNLARSSVPYDARHLAQRADDVEANLRAERFHERDSPGTWRGIDEMRQPAAAIGTGTPPALGATVDPAGIEFIRKGINKIPRTAERATDRESGRVVKGALDDFVINPPPGAIPPGYEAAAREASALGVRARDNNAGYRRAQAFDDLITGATDKGGSNYSGLNLENSLRNATSGFIKPTRGVSRASKEGYNADEIGALRRFARGENEAGSRMTRENIVRYLAKTAGGGSGLGALAGAGVGIGGASTYFKDDPSMGIAAGLALPAFGLGMRVAGNRQANANVRRLQEMINQRNPHYRDLVATSPMVPGPGAPRAAKGVRDVIATEIVKQQQRPETADEWE